MTQMASETLLLGAVAYDPKVVTIWDGFQQYFGARGLDFDYVLYSNYESQVEGQFSGHYHVAWNSPLAWIEADRLARTRGRQARALAMRDTDCDLTSVVVVRADSPLKSLSELRGKRVATGAADSPQAYLIPLLHLAEAGLEPERDFEVRRFDLLVGKHGDHIGGEREAARALVAGRTLGGIGRPMLLELIIGLAYTGAGILLLRLFEFESRRTASLETM